MVRLRSKSLFAPDQLLDRDKWGEFLVGHLTSPSCLTPPRREKKNPSLPPGEAGDLSEIQGVSSPGRRRLSDDTQSPGETQCYPR